MEKIETNSLPDNFVLPPKTYADIFKLIALLDKSSLSDDAIDHCKTGLLAIIIIHTKDCDTETDLLSEKVFDVFFTFFPAIYFNDRESIPEMMIIENIERCIKADKVVRVDS